MKNTKQHTSKTHSDENRIDDIDPALEYEKETGDD